MTNSKNSVLYIGVTRDVERRVLEHKNHSLSHFTDKYNCEKFVYYERFQDVRHAIAREKQLKGWRREWKNKLVDDVNPEWRDLMDFARDPESSSG